MHDRFVELLVKRVRALRLGDGTAGGVTQGPLITARAVDQVEEKVQVRC